MPSRRRRLDEAKRAGIAQLTTIGNELRAAREQAGLSQEVLAAGLEWRREKVSRVEHARLRTISLLDVVTHGAVLGLSVRTKVYPEGLPLRDLAQLSVSQRFLRRIAQEWRVRFEVPLAVAGDRRAVDLMLASSDLSIAVEVFTRLLDVQAQIRAAHLKWRDSSAKRLVVVVAESHANRAALRAVLPLLAADFPVGSRPALAALANGRDLGGNAIVVV